MAGEWRDTTIGACADFLSGGTPSKANPEYWNGDLPWLSAKDMKSFQIADTEDHVTELGAANGTKLVPAGTVLLLTRGMTLLNDVPICVAQRPMTFNQDVKALCAKPGIRSDYLAYLLLSLKPRLQGMVDLAGHGTGRLNTDELKAVDLRVPADQDEQRAIAHILGTLDDKIELNRRMDETLEAIARAIFKSWFVDFDPVRAKFSGEPPDSICRRLGLTPNLLALFPDRFVDSDLGEIPEGWKVGVLGDTAENLRRGVQPSEIPTATPYIALEHMPRHSIALSEWVAADTVESNKFEFKRGEILFGKLRPYFHKVGVAPIDGVCSTDILVVAPKSECWFGFVLGHASSDAFVEHTNAGSTGTKMPRTSWVDMSRYSIAIPKVALAHAFTGVIQPLVERINAGIHESRSLALARDALLPKLLSGELRVTLEGAS